MTLIANALRGASFLLFMAGASLAYAQQAYIVEVVLFSQPGAQIVGARSPEPNWADQAVLLDSTARSDVRRIDASRHQLSDQARQLSGRGYQIVMHKAWTQPADDGLTVAVREESQNGRNAAQGLVSLSQTAAMEADVSFWINHLTSAETEPVSELLRQTRRLRLGETHYLDHQSMGLLIKVSSN
ncbi:MAG TPA: hypothetical protein ENI17_03890 [Pseudomonas xinjiangensis]|uniref:Peptidoglycan-binding protein, CsiV n=2 Tax=root TaxID=1 RepID=A0A7V1FSK0_9GAMM|nr:hypothetical protein [Halopseudomonas xinjiangensis]HEC46749.1 hypothetical protein [Halopseudomonas xinjiangensis]